MTLGICHSLTPVNLKDYNIGFLALPSLRWHNLDQFV